MLKTSVIQNTTTQLKKMKALVVSISMLIGLQAFAEISKPISKEEYVSQWSTIAVEEMLKHNIPASITLAQGILESGSGNSELAREGNNHFGIKCHDWKGKKMYKDDDKKNECFRVYDNADESFKDHSDFLVNRSRYAALFTYDRKDYKSWARGLKDAGYATNPKYPDLLINLIETLKLDRFDEVGDTKPDIARLTKPKKQKNNNSAKESGKTEVVVESATSHMVYTHPNKVKYVVAKKGDTYYRIAKEFGLTLRQLHRYNDFDAKKDVLSEGDIVHIFPKRARAKEKQKTYQADKSILQIAQEEGVKVKSLMKLNNISSEETVVSKGEKVILR